MADVAAGAERGRLWPSRGRGAAPPAAARAGTWDGFWQQRRRASSILAAHVGAAVDEPPRVGLVAVLRRLEQLLVLGVPQPRSLSVLPVSVAPSSSSPIAAFVAGRAAAIVAAAAAGTPPPPWPLPTLPAISSSVRVT